MAWEKQGVIFHADGQHPWMMHHACVPTPWLVDDQTLRVYFAPRDAAGKSRVTYLETDPANPADVRYVHDRPVLDLGRLGTFDDSGAMPTCLVPDGDRLYLYYVGWSPAVTVPYRNSVGVAVSDDGGITFERVFEGPVVDRTKDEPFFTASPFVHKDGELWRMWYASSTGFAMVDGKPEPVYVIKYAESGDGFSWRRDGITRIVPRQPEEANARPWVVREDGGWKMWFCYRGSHAYRDDPAESYRIGYAESADGVTWTRKDEEVGIDISPVPAFDDTMVTYPAIYDHAGRRHLLYNGNGFGLTGIGHAVQAL